MQGAAYGGGLSLAAAADLRVADTTAKFCAAYIRIGLTGADMASSYLLPRLVGGSFAAEMMMTGRAYPAEAMDKRGFLSHLTEPGERQPAVTALVTDMLATAPLGLRLTKEAVHLGIDSSSMEATMALEDRHQTLLSMTDDAAEAMHLTEPGEREPAVAALVTDLLATAPLGLRLTKEAVHLGIDSSSMEATMALEDRHQTLLSMTDDAAEAMHAFQERRAPEYKGR